MKVCLQYICDIYNPTDRQVPHKRTNAPCQLKFLWHRLLQVTHWHLAYISYVLVARIYYLLFIG